MCDACLHVPMTVIVFVSILYFCNLLFTSTVILMACTRPLVTNTITHKRHIDLLCLLPNGLLLIFSVGLVHLRSVSTRWTASGRYNRLIF